MIVLKDVSYSYSPEGPPALTGLTLSIPTGTWLAITGPEGSGKTTLGKLIKGLLNPQSGSIVLGAANRCVSDVVGYLGGDPYDSLVGISVEEDVVFGLENLNLPAAEIRYRLEQSLAWSGLSGLEHRLVHTLSGGEQQKLALASVLAIGGRILVIDEAMNMLDRPSRLAVRSLIKSLQRDPGLTVIEITHDLADLLASHRVVYLNLGAVSFDGLPLQFLDTSEGSRWARIAGGTVGFRHALVEAGLVPSECSHEGLLEALLCYVKE
jgi:energy-coupling factor transport system ATP-binding protein